MWGFDDDDALETTYYENGYSDYETDTIDPGPWALITTIIFCAMTFFFLPLGVALRQVFRKRKCRQNKDETSTVSTVGSNETSKSNITKEEVTAENAKSDDDIVRLYGLSFPTGKSSPWSNNTAFCGAENAFFILNDLIYEDGEDEASLYGLNKERPEEPEPTPVTSIALVADNLARGQRWGGRRSEGLARLLVGFVGGMNPQEKEKEENHTAYNNLEPCNTAANSEPAESPFRFIGIGGFDHVEVIRSSKGYPDDEDLLADIASTDHRDFLTQLLDDFDLGNDDESVGTAEYFQTDAMASNEFVNTDGKSDKYKISVCCGSRPWYGYYFSSGFLRKLWKCASWDDEMKKIVSLAIPYTTHATLIGIFGLLEVAVIGQIFSGSNSAILGSYLAVQFILSVATMFLSGAISSLGVLCSHAVGGDNYVLAGKYCHIAIVFYQAIFLPIMAVIWNRMDYFVMLFGFDENVSADGQVYGRFAFMTTAVYTCDYTLHYMLDVCGFEWYSTIMETIHGFVSLVAVFLVGACCQDVKLWMLGAVHLSLSIIFLCLNVSIVIQKKWLIGFWEGFRSFALRDVQAVRVFLKTAIPLSMGYVMEYCEWEILFIFAAVQGPSEVIVWGLMGYIWGLGSRISGAVASASEVRVAKLLGSHHPALARYSSHKSLLLGITLSILMSLFVLALHVQIPQWLTKDEALQHMLSDLLPLVCVGVAALTLGNTSWTIICAQGRTRLPTTVTLLGSLFVSLPLALISTFVLNLNLQGLLASTVIGYAFSGIINSFIMLTSNWERISAKVAGRNSRESIGETKSQKHATENVTATGLSKQDLIKQIDPEWIDGQRFEI
jgi:Na+-driven multidrug efflux pump